MPLRELWTTKRGQCFLAGTAFTFLFTLITFFSLVIPKLSHNDEPPSLQSRKAGNLSMSTFIYSNSTEILYSNVTTTVTSNKHSLSKRGEISVQDCVLKGKPWGFVCCAHAWALAMHCTPYDNPELRLPDLGSCSPAPMRFNHGPFCGRMENTGFDDRYFKVYSLSKSREEGSWGRYSPEGKEIFRQALNGEYEPEDSFNRDWDREQWKSDDDEPMNIDK